MVERSYSSYLREAKKITAEGLSQSGRSLLEKLDSSLEMHSSAVRWALVLNTPAVSLFHYPQIETGKPNYGFYEGSDLDKAIAIKKLECQVEVDGFDEINALVEEGFAAMYTELTKGKESQIYHTAKERFHVEMMFIRKELMPKTEDGYVRSD